MIVPVHSIRIPPSHKSPRVPRHTCWIYRRSRESQRTQESGEFVPGLHARWYSLGNCLEGSSKVDRTSNIRRWIRIRLTPSLFEFHSNELASWMLAIWNIKLERARCSLQVLSVSPISHPGQFSYHLVLASLRQTIMVLVVSSCYGEIRKHIVPLISKNSMISTNLISESWII